MANSSVKKAQVRHELAWKRYYTIAIVITVVYLCIFLWQHGLAFANLDDFLPLVWFTAVTGVVIECILKNTTTTGTTTLWNDVLIVNWFVQLTSILFSSLFYLVYLCIPTYLIYQYRDLLKQCFRFLSTKLLNR